MTMNSTPWRPRRAQIVSSLVGLDSSGMCAEPQRGSRRLVHSAQSFLWRETHEPPDERQVRPVLVLLAVRCLDRPRARAGLVAIVGLHRHILRCAPARLVLPCARALRTR